MSCPFWPATRIGLAWACQKWFELVRPILACCPDGLDPFGLDQPVSQLYLEHVGEIVEVFPILINGLEFEPCECSCFVVELYRPYSVSRLV